MLKLAKNNQALTIMEMLISVSIISIVAAFAISNLNKALLDNEKKVASLNLKAIYSAEKVHYAKRGYYYPDDGDIKDLSEINAYFNINLNMEAVRDVRFDCSRRIVGLPPGQTFSCGVRLSDALETYCFIDDVSSDPVCF